MAKSLSRFWSINSWIGHAEAQHSKMPFGLPWTACCVESREYRNQLGRSYDPQAWKRFLGDVHLPPRMGSITLSLMRGWFD
ncbi:hypothetical protein L218DRAFT_379568 [Marasmius fiardii PR-910]|nr:hypothetical protein L218DRAFT_379568 [Marasmius fiardii PR-910]